MVIRKEEKADLEAQETNSEFDKYEVIFTLLYGGEVNQMTIEMYLTRIEAYRMYKTLETGIVKLAGTNEPIGISFVCRNAEGNIITYGLTGVVAISHSVPKLEIVDE